MGIDFSASGDQMSDSKRFLGITVMSPYFQNEGVDGVVSNLIERAGATAVACNTSVCAPSEEGKGGFQPPIDAGASVRLFDRPLWGKTALWLRSGPAFESVSEFYEGCPYQPRPTNDLTESDGAIIGQFIKGSKSAGLKVYIQTGAAQAPGIRPVDVPRLPNGEVPRDRMANTASLASEAVRRYNRAFIRDIFNHYPLVDGIRPDWPEYPCYKLDEAFQDFGQHVRAWAERHGFDFNSIQEQVGRFYSYLHGELKNEDLAEFASADRGNFSIFSLLKRFPVIADWLRLKAELSADILRDYRETITECAGEDKELSANAFMPPFSTITGLDFGLAAEHCESISPKLYTMHWSLIIKFWGDVLLEKNPGLDESLLVRALVHLLDLSEDEPGSSIEDYGYPEPDEPHPIPNEPQQRKIRQAIQEAGGKAEIYALVHGYGPLDDFCRRLQLVADSEVDGVWINRYGYLSDEKLDAIGQIWR